MKRGPKKAHLKLRRHVNTEMYMCESYGKQQVIYNLVIYKLRLKQLNGRTHTIIINIIIVFQKFFLFSIIQDAM